MNADQDTDISTLSKSFKNLCEHANSFYNASTSKTILVNKSGDLIGRVVTIEKLEDGNFYISNQIVAAPTKKKPKMQFLEVAEYIIDFKNQTFKERITSRGRTANGEYLLIQPGNKLDLKIAEFDRLFVEYYRKNEAAQKNF